MDENIQTGGEAPSSPVIPTDSEGYAKWRMTGEVPEAKSSKPANGGDADTSETNSDSGDKKPGQKSAPAPEAGKDKQETKPRSTAQTRLDEILSDLKTAGLSPAELKTYKREAKQQAAAEEKAAPEHTEKPPEKLARPKRPRRDDFYGEDDPDAAYEAAMDDHEAKCREIDRQEILNQIAQQQAQAAMVRGLQDEVGKSKALFGDEAAAVIESTAKELITNKEFYQFAAPILGDSEVTADLLYVMGKTPEDLQTLIALSKSNPGQAYRQLVQLEIDVKAARKDLGKGQKADSSEEGKESSQGKEQLPERDESGKFLPSRKVSKAPPPGEEIGGTKGSTTDESEAAAKAGDFRRFRDAENRKDLARMRGA